MRGVGIFGIAMAFILFSNSLQGQQEAMNAQFITNTMAFNPGYAGYKLRQAVTVDHRNQWVGFKGAPSTTNISFDIAPKNPRMRGMSFGANLLHDKIGPTTETSIQGIFAYGFRMDARSMFTVGIRSEFSLYQANFLDLDLTSEVFNIDDPNFGANPSMGLANFGIGFLYDTEDFFLGLSTPRLLKNRLDSKDVLAETALNLRGKSEPTYYLMGGYNMKLNAALDFQPALLTKATVGAPLSIGLYGTLIMRKKMKLGAFLNYGEVAGGMVYFYLNEKTEVGYSFDVAMNSLIATNFGSHEVTLTYNFRSVSRKIVYPRRF